MIWKEKTKFVNSIQIVKSECEKKWYKVSLQSLQNFYSVPDIALRWRTPEENGDAAMSGNFGYNYTATYFIENRF